MRLLYTLLLTLATPFVVLRLWWKGRALPAYRERIGERFGRVPAVPPNEEIAVWLHAVSVGETVAALPLIEALLRRHGERRVWVTTTTPTGSERVRAALGARVRHSYAPYDLPWTVARFLARVRPAQVVVMETELWPNLFAALARRRLPLTIVNARLSPRSFRGYGRVAGFARAVLGHVTTVAAQSALDAERFRRLGAPRVVEVGNLKFDLALPNAPSPLTARLRALTPGPVWAAVSTHAGEEEAALTAHRRLLATQPDALLLLVPRHPQRFDAVAALIATSGLGFERRSRLADAAGFAPEASAPPASVAPPSTRTAGVPRQSPDASTGTASADRASADSAPPDAGSRPPLSVLLVDSMGEVLAVLAAARLAFVGGSLVPVGGHNVLEPAALGLPVLFGPHMLNFLAARELLLGVGAGEAVADAAVLADAVPRLLADPVACARMGTAGRAAVAANRGALARVLAILDAA